MQDILHYIGGNCPGDCLSCHQHVALSEHIDSPGCSMCRSNFARIFLVSVLPLRLAVPGPQYHEGGAGTDCRVEYEEVCQSSYETQCSNSYQDVCLSVHQTKCSPYKEKQCFDVSDVSCGVREEKVCTVVEVPECQTKMEVIQEQQCSTAVEKVCTAVETSSCSPVTSEQCLTVPDVHCEEVPDQTCQTKLEVTQHQQCFSVSDVVCSAVHSQQCSTVPKNVCKGRIQSFSPRINFLNPTFKNGGIKKKYFLNQSFKVYIKRN